MSERKDHATVEHVIDLASERERRRPVPLPPRTVVSASRKGNCRLCNTWWLAGWAIALTPGYRGAICLGCFNNRAPEKLRKGGAR